jgi:F-type H+-transporting ATPase subunit epsilon
MLPTALELIIVTPEKQLLRESVVEVTIPGLDGQLGVLPGHAPLITELGIGELSYQKSGGSQPVVMIVLGGFAEVLPDRVTVLAETAERAEEIDLTRAEAALARAEKRLSASDSSIDLDRAAIAFRRATIRIQIARKYRGVPVGA